MQAKVKESKSKKQTVVPSLEVLPFRSTAKAFKKVIFDNKGDLILKKNVVKLRRFRRWGNFSFMKHNRNPQGAKSLKFIAHIDIQSYQSINNKKYMKIYLNILRKLNKAPHKYRISVNYHYSSPPALYKYWACVFSSFRSNSLKKINIHLRSDNSLLPFFTSTAWERFLSSIALAKNLSTLQLSFQDSTYGCSSELNNSKTLNYVKKLRRLPRLRNVFLDIQSVATNVLDTLCKTCLTLPLLERVGIKLYESRKLVILEALKAVKPLKILNISGGLEISDLTTLTQSHPNLQVLEFYGTWDFNSISPKDKTLIKKELNVKKVKDLRFNKLIRSGKDGQFYTEFLKAFTSLQTLEIYLMWGDKINFIQPYSTALASLKKLKDLTLTLRLSSLDELSHFFQGMRSLTAIKHFSLDLDVNVPKILTSDALRYLRSLREFLQSQKGLESLKIKCVSAILRKYMEPFLTDSLKCDQAVIC